MPRPKMVSPRIVLVVALLVLLVWASTALFELFKEPQGAIATQQRRVGGGKEAGLELVAWVEKNRALKEEPPFKIWFHVTNLDSSPVKDLRLTLYSPGFKLSPPIHAVGLADTRAPENVLWEIPVGISRTMWVDVVPVERSGDYMLTAAFTWTSSGATTPNQPVARSEALELGPLRLRSSRLELTASIKDLTLALAPVLITLLAAWLGARYQNRQQDLVQERQAWAAMLPVSHKLNFNLYLPLISAIATLQARLHKFMQDPTNVDPAESLFPILLALRTMRQIDRKGGFYLATRRGEEIVVGCWGDFAGELLQQLRPYTDLSSLLDAVRLGDSLTSFQLRLVSPQQVAAFASMKANLVAWTTGNKKAAFEMVFLFQELLTFEINRIYDFWYRDQGVFPEAACEKHLSELERATLFGDTTAQVRRYSATFTKR